MKKKRFHYFIQRLPLGPESFRAVFKGLVGQPAGIIPLTDCGALNGLLSLTKAPRGIGYVKHIERAPLGRPSPENSSTYGFLNQESPGNSHTTHNSCFCADAPLAKRLPRSNKSVMF